MLHRHLALALAATSCLLVPSPAAAQDPPVYVGDLAQGRYGTMQAMVEKTFLGIDAYELTVRVDAKTAQVIERSAAGQSHTEQIEAQIAKAASEADHAYVRLIFQRNVSFDRFITGITENLDKALEAGMISAATHRRVTQGLPRWFSFLEERGVQEGEQLLYKLGPNSLRTVYLDAKGRELLDQTDQGADNPKAVLAGFFAPGTDEREALIGSLFE